MTTPEDSTLTLVRLLQNNIQLVKTDGSLADIQVTPQWHDRQLLKNVDAQVTVGLDHCEDQKLGFSAKMRRRVGYNHVDLWVVDKAGAAGRGIRSKLKQEIYRVIREKRTKPNQTCYSYVGVGVQSVTHTAFYAHSSSELSPISEEWTEFSAQDYEKIWASDNERFSFSQSVENDYSFLLFKFKVESDKTVIKKIDLTFEGYGTADSGNGITLKAWNFVDSEWQNPQTGTSDEDEQVVISLMSDVSDFVDSEGYVYLVVQTTNSSDGSGSAVVCCDFVDCLVAVEGICYVDIVSYRDLDDVRVKPYIWRTQFMVKTWLFEEVTVT